MSGVYVDLEEVDLHDGAGRYYALANWVRVYVDIRSEAEWTIRELTVLGVRQIGGLREPVLEFSVAYGGAALDQIVRGLNDSHRTGIQIAVEEFLINDRPVRELPERPIDNASGLA